MARANKITIEQLIARKSKQDKFMIREVVVPSMGGKILLKKCDYNVILKAMDSISKDESMENIIETFKELIYKSAPILQSDELIKAYEVVEPFDIVTEVLDLGDIINLGNEILQLYGLDGMDNEIKN